MLVTFAGNIIDISFNVIMDRSIKGYQGITMSLASCSASALIGTTFCISQSPRHEPHCSADS